MDIGSRENKISIIDMAYAIFGRDDEYEFSHAI